MSELAGLMIVGFFVVAAVFCPLMLALCASDTNKHQAENKIVEKVEYTCNGRDSSKYGRSKRPSGY